MSLEGENLKICRVCLSFISENQSFDVEDALNTTNVLLREMVHLCVPEMDLELTVKPKVCETCASNIEQFYKFRLNCIETENKIRDSGILSKSGLGQKGQKIDLLNVIQSNGFALSMDLPENNVAVSLMEENNKEGDVEVIYDSDESELDFKRFALTNGSSVNQSNKNLTLLSCNVCSYMTTENQKLKKHKCFKVTKRKVVLIKCDLCRFNCKDPYSLISHKNMVHPSIDPTLLHCAFCSFRGRSQSLLEQHQILAHVQKKSTYDCKKCPYKAIRPLYLQQHIKSVHSIPVMLKCLVCGYSTSDRSNFKKHQYIHTKDKPHKCPVCKYQCISPYQMKKHVDKQHCDKKEFNPKCNNS